MGESVRLKQASVRTRGLAKHAMRQVSFGDFLGEVENIDWQRPHENAILTDVICNALEPQALNWSWIAPCPLPL
jgi:hypothetical protein